MKIIKIKKCTDCCWCHEYNNSCGNPDTTNIDLETVFDIPEWCPLEDAK